MGRSHGALALAVVTLLTYAGLPQPSALAAKKPDLVIGRVTTPEAATVGGKLAVMDITKNVGKKRAASSTTAAFLSKDRAKKGNDVRLGTRNVPGLAAGTSSRATSKLNVPKRQSPGNYYVIVCADDKNQVNESKEGNNCRTSDDTVRVKAEASLPNISISNPAGPVYEGGTTELEVSLSAVSTETVKVGYADVPGSATKPTDYVATSGTLTFSPGQTSKVLLVKTKIDVEVEPAENFKVRLKEPQNAVVPVAGRESSVTVLDESLDPTREIAFHRSDEGESDLWRVPIAGGTASLMEHPGDDVDAQWGYGDHAHKLFFSSNGEESDQDIYVRDQTTGTTTKVVDLAGDEHAPAISRDATLLAFHSSSDLTGDNPDGDSEIFVRTMAGGTITQLTDNAVDDTHPDWFPSSDALVYTTGGSSRNLSIVTNLSDPAPTELDTPGIDEANPVWSADGGTVAFDSDKHGTRDIFFLRVGTNNFQRVTKGPGDETMPTFSPNGQQLAFASSQAEAIVRLHIASCTETPLTSDPQGPEFAPDWKDRGDIFTISVPLSGCLGGEDLPIEGDIVFISTRASTAPNVYSRNLSGAHANVTRSDLPESDVAWNGDGTAIAFVRGNKLYVKDAATGAITRLTSFLEGQFSGVTWHPSAPVLAFGYKGSSTSGESTTDFDIVVHDQSHPMDLFVVSGTGDSANERMPDWSPDGTRLAFVSDKHGGPASSLYARSIALSGEEESAAWVGGSEERLTELAFDVSGPDWSPDGTDIAFSSPHPGAAATDTELYALAAATESVHRLSNDADNHKDPEWSPDFRTLIWARDAHDGNGLDIASIDLPSCIPSLLVSGVGADEAPGWRPDDSIVSPVNYRSCPGVTHVAGTGL